ncbi:MAG: hypothetical protein SVU32_07970 [Candidatus Nanohaloarchaea archaeon]|nr:hypothetical protein [Candidatus Nanohaloarchaea archaeon]
MPQHGDDWTDYEERFLANNWDTMTASEIASTLNRTEEAVYSKRYRMQEHGSNTHHDPGTGSERSEPEVQWADYNGQDGRYGYIEIEGFTKENRQEIPVKNVDAIGMPIQDADYVMMIGGDPVAVFRHETEDGRRIECEVSPGYPWEANCIDVEEETGAEEWPEPYGEVIWTAD